jgi:hypothetical protein
MYGRGAVLWLRPLSRPLSNCLTWLESPALSRAEAVAEHLVPTTRRDWLLIVPLSKPGVNSMQSAGNGVIDPLSAYARAWER